MGQVLVFPNYYKKCPKCGSKEIFFIEQDIISIKRKYKVLDNGKIDSNTYGTEKFTSSSNFPFYGCNDCGWVDFGYGTWVVKK